MARGRKPDPTRAKRGTGNRPATGEQKAAAAPLDRALQAVPDAPVQPWPDPTPDIPDADHGTWHRVMSELWPRGLRESDVEGVRMLVVAASRHRQAAEGIAKSGVLLRGRNGQAIVNPLVKVEKDAAATYMRLANEFGLTIAARLRLGLIQLAGQSILQSLDEDLRTPLEQ